VLLYFVLEISMAIITLTEAAVKELKTVIADQHADEPLVYMRAAVKGGGCSGFQHILTLDEHADEKLDIIEEQDGIKIAVDKRSAMYLEGTTIDFHNDLNKRGFAFNNPGAKTTCGCGSSFSM